MNGHWSWICPCFCHCFSHVAVDRLLEQRFAEASYQGPRTTGCVRRAARERQSADHCYTVGTCIRSNPRLPAYVYKSLTKHAQSFHLTRRLGPGHIPVDMWRYSCSVRSRCQARHDITKEADFMSHACCTEPMLHACVCCCISGSIWSACRQNGHQSLLPGDCRVSCLLATAWSGSLQSGRFQTQLADRLKLRECVTEWQSLAQTFRCDWHPGTHGRTPDTNHRSIEL